MFYTAQTLAQRLALLQSLYADLRNLAHRWGRGAGILLVTAVFAACGGGAGGGDTMSPSGGSLPVGTSAPTLALLAGNLVGVGSTDGIGAAVRFRNPRGVTVDSVGNIYVADLGNSTIRKITPAGVVTTLAGTALTSDSTDGTGPMARFRNPGGVTLDSLGNVYVADAYNHTIRKITPTGVVTTFAGTAGVSGSANGIGPAARFYKPDSVIVDGTGNVYVADTYNYTIRKITPAGVVTTLAGSAGLMGSSDGTGTAARFKNPGGVTVDSTGNVYVADTDNHTIRKITPAGVVTTLAGTAGASGSADGVGAMARFYAPGGVTVDSTGNLYVADYLNHTIRKITPAGAVTTLAGAAGVSGSIDGIGAMARFYAPEGVTVDNTGNVYVADFGNHTIRRITPTGAVTTLAGTAPVSGSTDGTGTAARFQAPFGITVDSTGNVYVADTDNHTIRKITPAGVVTTLAGTAGASGSADGTGVAARFKYPSAVTVDSTGNVYVADTSNDIIRKITPTGVVTTLAGLAGASGSADGTGAVARFHAPFGITVDGAGMVYVADTHNHTVRKITPAGVVTTLAGTAGVSGSTDGIGSAARFNYPGKVTVASTGNVYVADIDNHTIRMITPAGVVTTLAGTAGASGSVDGTGAMARFDAPEGVTVDSTGNLYVADYRNHTIRKITTAGVVTTLVGVAGQGGDQRGDLPGLITYPYGLAIMGRTLYFTSNNGVAVVYNLP